MVFKFISCALYINQLSPRTKMETFHEPQTNLLQIQMAEPVQIKQNHARMPKDQYFKIYQAVYRKLIIEHSEIIQYLKGNTTKHKELQLSQQQINRFAPYLSKIQNQQVKIKTHVYEAFTKQLLSVLTQSIDSSGKLLAEKDFEQYDKTTAIIQQFEKKKFTTQQLAPTRYTLFRIDLLSFFLRQNQRYKFYIKSTTAQNIFSSHNLPKILNFSKQHIVEFIKIYEKVKNHLKYDHWSKLKIIISIIFLVQLRYKISNFQQRAGKQAKQIKQQIEVAPNMIILRDDPSNQDENDKYRLSELVFFELGSKKIEKLGFKIKEQIAVRMNFLKVLDSHERRMELLKLSVLYNIQIESLMQYIRIESQERAADINADIEKGRKILKDIQKCQWLFIINISQGIHQSIQKITGLQVKIYDLFDKNGIYNYIWKKLYILGMERLKLASMVYKKQMKVLQQFQDQEEVFISKWEYFQNHKANPYNSLQQKNHRRGKKPSFGQKCITFIMATTNDKLLFYCIVKNKLKKDRYYLQILSKAFEDIKYQSSFRLNLYQMGCNNKRLQAISQYRISSYFKRSYRADVYSISSSEKLASHLLANEIISTYALQVNGDDFYDKMERIINRVINNLSIILGWSTNG